MVKGGSESYRWFVYITTLLLQEASWLPDCIVGHPNCTCTPSIILVLLEPHCFVCFIAPTLVMSLDGTFRSVTNTSFPDGCLAGYGAYLDDQALLMTTNVNGIVSSQLCAHVPNFSLGYISAYVSGQGTQVIVYHYK